MTAPHTPPGTPPETPPDTPIEGRKPLDRPLKKGWTTGACAAAAAAAAWRALNSGAFEASITIRLPQGQTPSFRLATQLLGVDFAVAGVVKDAGDDPDVTHGLEIIADVQKNRPGVGITFAAGDGVGTVRLKGLPLPPGEPAINPGPRAQIIQALQDISRELNLGDDMPNAHITLSIPGGREVALKTMNARLGIEGGLSVLGTTGIVVPYSCSSWIHSIHRGIDVARAQNMRHVLASTGRTSESAANAVLALPDAALIDMGDFAGGLLKYVRSHPVDTLTLAGGFAKLAKLAQGEMDLHSSRSAVDFNRLADLLARLGGPGDGVAEARTARTAQRVLELADEHAPQLAHIVARQAREVALATLAGGTDVQVWVYDRAGRQIATSVGASE
ncbi:MAG: cobalt-precorrin-5B (C(1))-methyltransferase [Rhodospirillales bacterium]|nr:cobalt-precorrin-5B (C(1))-methyltransferase [Rhodospirillales bacterium]